MEESLSDKVLTRCEVLKRAVHDILDGYNNADRSSKGKIFLLISPNHYPHIMKICFVIMIS